MEKTTSARYSLLSGGKVVSLFLEGWASTNTTEVNERRQEGRNVVLLEAVLPRNVIYIYIYIMQKTKAVCVHKQE